MARASESVTARRQGAPSGAQRARLLKAPRVVIEGSRDNVTGMPSKKVPTLPPHSTYVLRSMAEHVGYEVQQMGDATKLIRAGEFPTDRPTFDRVVRDRADIGAY